MGRGRTDGSYTSGCSDVATWTSSSAHITTSGVVAPSRGVAAGTAAGASYFVQEGMGGGGDGGGRGGSVTGASVHYAEVPSVAVLMTTASKAKLPVAAAAPAYVTSAELLAYQGGSSSSSFNGASAEGGEVEAGTGSGLRREGSNRSRPL